MKNLFLILLFAQFLLSCTSLKEKFEKPNVLVILADDLGYHDLGCYGVKDFKTPNIDRIATSGIRFTDGYVTAPQCGPSRAGLMTGISQARFGVTYNSVDFGLPPREVVETLPEQMKAQGYATGMVGKWHIGFHDIKKDRTKSYTRPGNAPWERGFDYTFKIFAGSAQYFPYATPDFRSEIGWIKHLQEKREDSAEPVYLADLPKDTYMTDIFTERGIDFILRHKDEPWFLYLSYTAPHSPMQPKPDKFEKYAHIKNDSRRKFVAMMESLDEGIGKVLDTLEETGQLENTVVWFLSDNGGVSIENPRWNGSRNDPFSGAKGDVFEGGIRIPFMVSWPGKLPSGKTVSDPVTALDILPTCVAVAGKEQVSEIHEGRNLLPWLKGDAIYPAKDLYWTWRGDVHAIRSGTLKEIRNGKAIKAVDGTEIPKHNFVDLATNPTELAGEHTLQSPEKKQQLARRLDAWLEKVQQDAEKLTPLDEQ
jgi:arylsulfatase A-like enzyme